MGEGQEQTFFEHGDVKVTNARFIVPSQTYAMSGITSVKFFTEKPSMFPAIVGFVVAVIMLGNNGSIWTVGIPAMIGVALFMRKPTHHVVLSSASGETRALASQDKQYINSVIDGLNQAIIARG